jgi:hypothetical protein
MFSSTRQVLLDGGVVAVFGEGVSHDTPGLKDLKTGPARIALGTPTDLSMVPVGLVFPDRPRYRSTVTVVVGEPIRVEGCTDGDTDRTAVLTLTDQLSSALAQVAPTWERQDDQTAAYAAARVVATVEGSDEGAVLNRINRALDARIPVSSDVLNASKDLLDECEHLDVDLQHVLDDNSTLGALARSSHLRALLWALPAMIGHLINYPAYFTVDRVARRNDFNFQATAKVLAGVVLYPAWWVVLFIGTWVFASLGWAISAVVGSMLGGYVAGAKMHLLKSFNARLIVEDNDTDLSSLERRFYAVISAVGDLPD